MKQIQILKILVLLTIISCNKESFENNKDSYFPMTINNTQTYVQNETDTFTIEIDKTEILQDKEYYHLFLKNVDGSRRGFFKEWIKKEDNRYTVLTKADGISQHVLEISSDFIKTILIDLNYYENGVWINDVSTTINIETEYPHYNGPNEQLFEINTSNKIKRKGFSEIVNGKSFKNCIEVEITNLINDNNSYVIYCQGVGRVKSYTEDSETILIDYNLF